MIQYKLQDTLIKSAISLTYRTSNLTEPTASNAGLEMQRDLIMRSLSWYGIPSPLRKQRSKQFRIALYIGQFYR